MAVVENLNPKKVFHYFGEICKIPHGSGNVDRLSDYLVDFAKDRGLFYIQDTWKNVIIVKEATPGYEGEAPIILQGHMDMVAVKKTGASIDMAKEGLRLLVDGDDYMRRIPALAETTGLQWLMLWRFWIRMTLPTHGWKLLLPWMKKWEWTGQGDWMFPC